MEGPRVITIPVEIQENGFSWSVAWPWNQESPTVHPSAFKALQEVKDLGEVAAEVGFSTAIKITWNPTTKIGKIVVGILTS